MSAASIASDLGGRKPGSGWTARCPAHDDHMPSLSITDADDGKALARCHAGCESLARNQNWANAKSTPYRHPN